MLVASGGCHLPPPDVVNFVGHEAAARCGKCRKEGGLLYECGLCLKGFHRLCLRAEEVPQRPGPWYCWICLRALVSEGVADVTLDQELLDFLANGQLPDY